MKNSKFKTKRSILTIVPILITMLIITNSCEDEFKTTSFVDANSMNDKELIFQLGFDTIGIEQRDNYYIVEGDILLFKNRLLEYDNLDLTESKLKQARVNTLINFNNQINITVRVDNSVPTSGNDNWRPEILQAINDWNNIPDSRIHLVYTTSATADITVSNDGGVLNDGTYNSFTLAQASWPIAGNAGPTIIINLDAGANRTFSTSQKRYNMVHELGHCLGLRHTNWNGLGESSGIGISGTPNTGSNPDPNSVMNGGTALNSWNGFSNYDKIALQVLYPGLKASVSGPNCLPKFGSATWTANGINGDGTYTYRWIYLIKRGSQKIGGIVYSKKLTLNFQTGDSFSAGLTVYSSGESATGSTGPGFMYACTVNPY